MALKSPLIYLLIFRLLKLSIKTIVLKFDFLATWNKLGIRGNLTEFRVFFLQFPTGIRRNTPELPGIRPDSARIL